MRFLCRSRCGTSLPPWRSNLASRHVLRPCGSRFSSSSSVEQPQQANKERDMMAEFQVYPIGTKETWFTHYVQTSTRVLQNNQLEHEVHPMGIIVQGSTEECLAAMKECIQRNLRRAPRVVLSCRADIRPGTDVSQRGQE
ncbi:hypothetical protein QOT17_011269 [Balamuthia mandrillaris]